MKEKPLRDYEEQNSKSPIIGTRAEESFRRAVGWMKSGCNSFAVNRAKSTPLSLWMESDVLRYIDENGIKMSPMYIYGGMKRTGCMFCPVPIAHGDYTNIEYARIHYPKIFETIIIKHGLKRMLELAQEILTFSKADEEVGRGSVVSSFVNEHLTLKTSLAAATFRHHPCG